MGGPKRLKICAGESGFRVSKNWGLRKDHVEVAQRSFMKSLNPSDIAPPFARYSHGIELPPNARLLRTSGQLGLAQDETVPDGAEAQADICFANILAILAEGRMTTLDVCHVSAFVTDRRHMSGYMAARDRFLQASTVLPSSTLVIVSGFTRPEFVVEVEVWAAAV